MTKHISAQDVQRGALVLERCGQHEAHGALSVDLGLDGADVAAQGPDVMRLDPGRMVDSVGEAQQLPGDGEAVLERAVQGEGVQVALWGYVCERRWMRKWEHAPSTSPAGATRGCI